MEDMELQIQLHVDPCSGCLDEERRPRHVLTWRQQQLQPLLVVVAVVVVVAAA